MVRPVRSETERQGEFSKAGEFVYDHPFQWGSKRTGPDLAREGVGNLKKSDAWHFRHLREPQSMSEGSVMPAYAFMIDKQLNTLNIEAKINAMRTLGVPYPVGYEKIANDYLMKQAKGISNSLKADNIEVKSDREIIAVIAYLQRLGVDISKQNKTDTLTVK